MKKVSFYETGNPIPHGRALGAYVLDFLTLTIISLLFFLGVDAIGVQLPKSVTYINYDAEVRNDLFSLMLESHLDEKNADGSQKGSSAITSAFLYNVALASLENNHVSDISTNTYSGFSAITPSTDNAYSYFVFFKKENKGSFMADDKDFAVISDEETYRQALVKACDGNDYFEIQCPNCGEDVMIDFDMIDDDNAIVCPNCHEEIELEFDCNCDDDDCDCGHEH